MLKRTVSFIFFSTINNRRLFSLTTISNRQQQKNINEYPNEINNQHRPFGKFHSRPSNVKNRIQQNKNQEREMEDLDVKKPQFNRYNVTQSRSRIPYNKKPLQDDENDLFSEEKDDLTMLGTDKKAFSFSSTTPAQKPSTTAVSLNKKPDK
jgi:hypothetical protein